MKSIPDDIEKFSASVALGPDLADGYYCRHCGAPVQLSGEPTAVCHDCAQSFAEI